MSDPIEGRMLDVAFLTKSVKQANKKAKGKYTVSVLCLSEADFNGHLYAIKLHGYAHHIINNYKALGIKQLIWAEDLKDNEFILCSGKGLDPNLQTIIFPSCSAQYCQHR